MFTESTYLISKPHLLGGLPCQDYASHTENHLYVSDGCSSSANSDIGARIITRIAMDMQNQGICQWTPQSYIHYMTKMSESICNSMGLPHMETMRATHLHIKLNEYLAQVKIIGDGTLGVKMRDGTLKTYTVSNEFNIPFYPVSYYAKDMEESEKLYAVNLIEREFDEDMSLKDFKDADLPQYLVEYGWQKEFDLKNVYSIGIFSDGIEQVEGTTSELVINSFLDISNSTKGFLHRKVNKLSRKTNFLEKLNDDFSAAVALL